MPKDILDSVAKKKFNTHTLSPADKNTPTDAGIVFQATVAILLGIFVPLIIGVVMVLSLLILLYYHHRAKHLDSKTKEKELANITKTIDIAEKQLDNKDNSKEVILKLLDVLLKAMGHIAGDETDSPPRVKKEFSFSGSSCHEEGLNSEVVEKFAEVARRMCAMGTSSASLKEKLRAIVHSGNANYSQI